MKRPYFQKKALDTNNDIINIKTSRNICHNSDGVYFWGDGNSPGTNFYVKKCTTLDSVSSIITTATRAQPFNFSNSVARAYDPNIICVSCCSEMTALAGSILLDFVSSDKGATFHSLFYESYGVADKPKAVDICNFQDGYFHFIYSHHSALAGSYAVFIRKRTQWLYSGYYSLSITDPDYFMGGYMYSATEYRFLVYRNSVFKIYSYTGSANPSYVKTITGPEVPTLFDAAYQFFWEDLNSQFYNFLNVERFYLGVQSNNIWSYSSIGTDLTTRCVILGTDHLGSVIPKYIIYNASIQQITDKGVLKKIQALEPRDYKKVYLSNLNENLPGVVQFQDNNGNDDLSAWTDTSGADCAVSIVESVDGHRNVMELDDQSGVARIDTKIDFSAAQANGFIELFLDLTDTDKITQIFVQSSASSVINIGVGITNGWLSYYDGSWHTIVAVVVSNPYHLKITFECGSGGYDGLAADKFNIYVDGTQYGSYDFDLAVASVSNIRFLTNTANSGYQTYIDGLGFSWDSYVSGSNKKINAYVGFLPNNVSAWDHKLTYLTNEEITGIVPWGTAADPDLSKWPDVAGLVATTKEIVAQIGRHTNVLHMADAGTGLATYSITESGTLIVDIWLYPTESVADDQLLVSCTDDPLTTTRCGVKLENGIVYNRNNNASNDTGETYIDNTWIHFRVEYVSSTTNKLYMSGVLIYTEGTPASGTVESILLGVKDSVGYFDAVGIVSEGYTNGDNNVFPNLTFPKPWFATGDAETGLMELSLKNWSPGTMKALVETEMYKAPKYSLARLTPPFEDEWIDQYTDEGQHYYGGKVADNNNDHRFFWMYLMKNWQDENKNTKINETLLGYTHKEMLEYVLDKYSKYRWYGAGTNGNVNEFTPSQIDGTDDDWTNADGASCESTYVTQKAFLNGFMYHVLQQYDNNGAGRPLLTSTAFSGLIFSCKIATSDITKNNALSFYEGTTRIGILRIYASELQWYDGGANTLQAAVNETIYHVALVFSATDDDVDIYVNGVFNSTQSLENNITTEINKMVWNTDTAASVYYSYYAQIYAGDSLVDAMHTFSSISPLLTTTYDFHLKNQTLPGLQQLIAEETGYVVSERPDGQVYVDQYAASGKEINAQVAITYQSLMQIRNEKFSFITFYGGFVNGKQIEANGFGEPNFGSYEDWFPAIQGRDEDDVYYDDDGNPKSHRLDAMVTTALANKNIVVKKQKVGKRGEGMYHVGTSFTYTTDHYKIASETWNAWRKNAYDAKADDNRLEIADSFLSPTKSDPSDDPTTAKIEDNTQNITKNDQNIAYLAERTRSRDVLSFYLEENQRNLDQHVWGFFRIENTGVALDSGTPINYSVGCHRILIVVNAGTDLAGTLTITGTTIDRNDSNNTTPGDTEDIVISGLTTNASTTDAEGNAIHSYTTVYMSDNWFQGAITITTTDLTLTDVDTFGVLYHQFDSFKQTTIHTLDFTGQATNANAWFYAYLYFITRQDGAKTYDITKKANLDIPQATTIANEGYRRRKCICELIDCYDGDGVWLEIYFGPSASTYWHDISIYLTALLDSGTNE